MLTAEHLFFCCYFKWFATCTMAWIIFKLPWWGAYVCTAPLLPLFLYSALIHCVKYVDPVFIFHALQKHSSDNFLLYWHETNKKNIQNIVNSLGGNNFKEQCALTPHSSGEKEDEGNSTHTLHHAAQFTALRLTCRGSAPETTAVQGCQIGYLNSQFMFICLIYLFLVVLLLFHYTKWINRLLPMKTSNIKINKHQRK